MLQQHKMFRMRVLLLLMVALSGVLCEASKVKERDSTKRTAKPIELKKIEKKSTNEKRESSELAEYYSYGQKEEPFRPMYQFQYPGAPLKATSSNYVAAATSPQLSYSKPDTVIGIGASGSGSESSSSGGGIQYAAASAYKSEGGIQYAPSSYKANTGGGGEFASSAYRGPFIAAPHQAPVGQARAHPAQFYVAQQGHPSPALGLPLHYGGIEQALPSPQHHQQNQYAITFPAEYMRHYQQNLGAYPLHGAQMVQFVYASSAAPHPNSVAQPVATKDQQYKQTPVQYISLSPHHLASPPGAATPAAGPTVITHIIPLYGSGGHQHQHQHMHHQSPAAFYYGAYPQQASPQSFAYAGALHPQQTIQKQQIYGPIQIAAIGAAAAATVPYKPVVDAQQQQQLQQPHNQFYQHYHPGAASYTRYSQSLSGSNESGGGSNPIEVPAYEASSPSAPKQGPLYSSSSSTNAGNTYSGATGGGNGKMSYTYGTDPNYEGPVYAHPGAIHYGTHLYQPPSKVVQIGSNRVTAGSAAIAGVSPPAFHPQQQSTANNSHGGRGSSSSVVKFA